MKLFKLIALSATLTIGAFSVVLYSSCNKTSDPCSGITCQNGGTCSSGTCVCPSGYEGSLCQTVSRNKVIKIWSASDVQVSPVVTLPTYTSAIAAGAGVTDVKISNFSAFFTNDVNATFLNNTLTIVSQTPDNDTFSVSGTGTYDTLTKKITWSYTLTNPQNVQRSYTGTWQ